MLDSEFKCVVSEYSRVSHIGNHFLELTYCFLCFYRVVSYMQESTVMHDVGMCRFGTFRSGTSV